jgi:hypothetical protein
MAKGGGERKKVKGSLKWECGIRNSERKKEDRALNAEVGMRNAERKKKTERIKVGIRKVNED